VSEVVWLPEALADVARLRAFLEDKSPSAAARAAQTLRDGARLLRSFPESGRPMNDDTDRREVFLSLGCRGLRPTPQDRRRYGGHPSGMAQPRKTRPYLKPPRR